MKTVIVGVLLCCLAGVLADVSTEAPSSTTAAPSPPPTTTVPVELLCKNANADCGTCVKNAKCLWCPTQPDKCVPYPASQIIPKKDICDLSDARWGVCWVNYKVLLIVMGVLAGVIIISLSCCIYCCCCRRKKSRSSLAREETALEREREERRNKHSERRQERQSRMDDIRRKYGLGGNVHVDTNEGLSREGGDGYRRFDNEA